MAKYADYCPITLCVDILGDRWSPLVIRELMVGAHGFNEIHRGVPRMSRTLLAQRLRQLEKQGLITRDVGPRGTSSRYELTPAGQGLVPIVWAMGAWASEWCFGDPTDDECDGISFLWRLHQRAVPAKLPVRRTVVHFILTGPGAAQGWLDVERSGVTVCRDDQGLDVDLVVEANTGQMHRWLAGLVPFRELVNDGHARLIGPSRLARSFPSWWDTSTFAESLRRGEQRRESLAATG